MTLGSSEETLPGEGQRAHAGEPALRPGEIIDGRYRMVRRIGEGGMGEVWEVEHVGLKRPLALKLLRAAELASPTQRARFLREAQVIARVRHPGVVEITDSGELPGGGPFIAMELLGGRTLAEVSEHDGALPWARALELVKQIADALAEVHRHGVVHRDLKPDNVFVTPGPPETIKVIDFGIARHKALDVDASQLTATGTVFGTPGYMAPEQIKGERSDARADIYALGCIAHELISGRYMFDEDDIYAVLSAHVSDPAPPLPSSVPAEVVQIVERCLVKDRDQRFQSMEELSAACTRALAGAQRRTVPQVQGPPVPNAAMPPAIPPRSTYPRSVVVGVLAVAFVAATGALYLVWPRGEAPAPNPVEISPPVSEPVPEVATPSTPPPPPAQPAPEPVPEVEEEPVPEVEAEPVVEEPAPKPAPPPPQDQRRKPKDPPPATEPAVKPKASKPKRPKRRSDGMFDPFG